MTRILPIARMGEPILKQIAAPVDLNTEYSIIKQLISDMKTTLNHECARVGLAAPQVFVSKRVILFRIPKKLHARYATESQQEIPLTALINPTIRPLSSSKVNGYEACISIPSLVGVVPRYREIEYTYQDLKGNYHTLYAHGFHARVIQHEYDHLDGILYPEKIIDMTTFEFEDIMLKALNQSAKQ